jgi:hypothetical protein
VPVLDPEVNERGQSARPRENSDEAEEKAACAVLRLGENGHLLHSVLCRF